MKQVSFRGGAQAGWVNNNWPFAKLMADREQLRLSGVGTFTFSPSDVAALEPYGSIPLIAMGIRIRHNRPDYPEKVIFWCMGSRERVLDLVADTGFHPKGKMVSERPWEFPIRWSVLLVVFILWNILFMLDIFRNGIPDFNALPLGPLSCLAFLLLFGVTSAIKVSTRLQNLVMREGHSFGEIKYLLSLTQFVSGLLALLLSIPLLAG